MHKNDVTKIDPTKFSPELKAALTKFGKAFVRLQAVGYATERAPSGIIMTTMFTRPKSIGEDYDAARATLLTFREELPVLSQIDYQERGKQIHKALARTGTDDEIAEELEAAERDIKQLEDKLAAIGLKLGQ